MPPQGGAKTEPESPTNIKSEPESTTIVKSDLESPTTAKSKPESPPKVKSEYNSPLDIKPEPELPKFLFLALAAHPPKFQSTYHHLRSSIHTRTTNAYDLFDLRLALRLVCLPERIKSFAAVLVTDHAVAFQHGLYFALWPALLDCYVRKGGIVILCCDFPFGVTPQDFNDLLNEVDGLGWEVAGCSRSEYVKDLPPGSIRDGLPESYNWNAVTLKAEGMKPGESWYSNARGDSAAAMAKVGEGWLGYVGNVDADDETTKVVLRMCGLPSDEVGV